MGLKCGVQKGRLEEYEGWMQDEDKKEHVYAVGWRIYWHDSKP